MTDRVENEMTEAADGWRADAIARLNGAHESVTHADAQYNLLRGIADLLLAIDTRLSSPVPPVEPGPCMALAPHLVVGGEHTTCDLRWGHAGGHEAHNGSRWTSQCDVSTGQDPWYRCVKPEGHPGLHEDGTGGVFS